MSTVLVTGAAGFIGSHFSRYWLREHPEDTVIALDALTYAGTLTNLADIKDQLSFVHGDIADADAMQTLFDQRKIDVVVNFAAESHNSLAVLDPTRFFRTNVLGTQTLLDVARRHEIARFHHISTCEVYGDLPLDADTAFTEHSRDAPRTPYNASKAGADHAVRAYYETFELPITITNCANNYGPNQFPEKVIPLFITHALTGQKLPVYASKHNTREWIHVLDHCSAIDYVLDKGEIGQTYHVGTGYEASIEQIATLILDELGLSQDGQTEVADRPAHDRRYLLDSTKIRRELGWQPQIDFATGLTETIQWYVDHRDWWQPLLDKSPVSETAWSALPGEK